MSQRLATLKESLDVLKETPELLASFKTPFNNDDLEMPQVQIFLQEQNGEISKKPIIIKDIFPTFTIQDILRKLWTQVGTNEWLPEYTFLGIPNEDSSEYEAVKGTWYFPFSQNIQDIFTLPSPIKHIKEGIPFKDFVAENGEKQPMNFKMRDRTTIETLFLRERNTIPILHAFCLPYLQRLYQGPRPYSSRAWYGLFYPYFPTIEESGPFEPSPKQLEEAASAKKYITLKVQEAKKAEQLISEPYPGVRITSIQHLQFEYNKPERFNGCDLMFYGTNVTESIPFLRYIPANGQTMTKLYRPNALTLPFINDCDLLRDWTEVNLPYNATELVVGKFAITEREPAYYGSLRLFEDGRADITLQPPKNIRALDFPKELKSEPLVNLIRNGLQGIISDIDSARFVQATVNFGIHKEDKGERKYSKGRKYTTEISRQIFKERLSHFKTFFQEISPSEEEKGSQLMIRYKGVDNFDSEDKIEAYCTFQATKKLLEGDSINEDLVINVSREFGLSVEEARYRVAKWISKKSEMTVIDSKEAAAAFNPGTDIAIYLQHPDYIFHVYRVESLESFERIVAFMNIIIGASDEFFTTKVKPSIDEIVSKEEEPVESIGESVVIDDSPADRANIFDFEDAEIDETNQGKLTSTLPSKKTVEERLNEMKVKPVEKIEEEDEQRSIVPYKFFINRLKQLDKTLFEFKTTSTADKPYSILCQANVTVQPLAMNEREYNRMVSIYRDDIDENKMIFIEYGGDYLEEQIKQSKAVENVKNRFTVVKYGSSVENKNYYLCARYFCLNDYVVILENEFKAEGSFRGRQKKANECPFCTGKVIPHEHIKQNIPPVKGETILERRAKPKSDGKIPDLIQFLGEGKHPQGFNLPCCYTKEPKGKELARLTALSKKTAKKKVDSDDENSEEEDLSIRRIVEYDALRAKVSQLYIKDSAKFPLSSGTFGICGPALDDFFNQDSQELVERVAIQQRLKPTGEGFLRVGVQNSSLDLSTSLFSALAPILNQRSWKEVGEFLKNQIQPRAFINLNFGNLLLEFYDNAINNPIDEKSVTPQAISVWASEYLKADIVENEVELRRFYLAYRRFTRYLTNSSETKQLRHIYHALSEPGLITTNGLTLIVLEYKGNPASADVKIDIKCPSLGFDISRYDRNDIVFITRDSKGFYEPLAYVQKQLIGPTKIIKQEAIYKFAINQLSTVNSSAIRQRINEFISQCSSSYRGYYTSQSHIDSRLLIPISVALKTINAVGLIRDSYNHLVAISIPVGKGLPGEVVVPIADDGYIAHKDKDLRIYVSWASVENNLADAKDVYTIYSTIVRRKLLPFSKQYTLIDFLKEPDNKIRAYRIGLSDIIDGNYPPIVLPCKETDASELGSIDIPITEQAKISFPFKEESKYIMTESVLEEDSYVEPESIVEREQLEELYQTFRLTFANWLVTNEFRAEFRGEVKNIIDPRFRLPLYEQRRRLEILIGPILAKMLYADPKPFDIIPKLRRINCLKLSEDSCGGSCIWLAEDKTCRLHLPQKPDKDIVNVFILRLIDELIRLPAYANELLTNKVQKIQIPKKAIQIEDQYYLPNNSPELTELFQQLCSKKEQITDEPKFYEEFGINPDDIVYSKEYENIGKLVDLPEQFTAYLSETAKKSLRLLVVDGPDSADKTEKLAGVFPTIDSVEFNKLRGKNQFSEANLNYISGIIRLPVIQFLLNPSSPQLKILSANYGSKPYRQGVVVFLPDAPQGPGFVVLADQRKPQIPIDILEGELKMIALKATPLKSIVRLEEPENKPTQKKRKVLLVPNNSD